MRTSSYYPAWKNALSYMLLLNRNIKILEIGCGAGQFANLLFDNGFVNYMGFDYAEEGVKLSRQNNPEHQDDFFVADAFTTPEVASRQGLIICFEVLEHIDNDIELLNRIQKGTKMLLSVPNFDDPYHVRFFSSEKEVYDRYSETVQIYDVNKFELRPGYCLYYVIGEKNKSNYNIAEALVNIYSKILSELFIMSLVIVYFNCLLETLKNFV